MYIIRKFILQNIQYLMKNYSYLFDTCARQRRNATILIPPITHIITHTLNDGPII